MEKAEEIEHIIRENVVYPISVRCRDCVHFKNIKSPAFSSICATRGILPQGRPCNHFLVDANAFSFTDHNDVPFFEYIQNLPSARLSIIAALIEQEKTTRRYKFKMGELVFVKMFPGDYLSNYFQARIILANTKHIFVEGVNPKYRLMLLHNSVFRADEFSKKEKSLRSRGLLHDPNFNGYSRPRKARDVEEEIKAIVKPKPIDTLFSKDGKLNKPDKKGKKIKPKITTNRGFTMKKFTVR